MFEPTVDVYELIGGVAEQFPDIAAAILSEIEQGKEISEELRDQIVIPRFEAYDPDEQLDIAEMIINNGIVLPIEAAIAIDGQGEEYGLPVAVQGPNGDVVAASSLLGGSVVSARDALEQFMRSVSGFIAERRSSPPEPGTSLPGPGRSGR